MHKKTQKSDQENASLCKNCDHCCRYIALEIDKPTTKAEKENIIWFLLHKNISVYIGHDNHWYVEFQTPCKALHEGRCSVYNDRPSMCREYNQDSCTKYINEPAEKIIFTSPEQFKKYFIKKNIIKK
jgi:hypothetical protein